MFEQTNVSTELRECNRCSLLLPLNSDYFHRRRSRGDNVYETTCKKCRNLLNAERRKANREAINARARQNRRDNAYVLKKRREARRAAMTEEERERQREKQRRYDETFYNKRVAEWLAEHGELPLCACGCGEAVKFDSRGKPQKYAGINHHFRTIDLSGLMVEEQERRREASNAIPIEKFRAAARQVKDEVGLSWPELAEKGGWSHGQLNYYMYDKRIKSVGRDVGENFFKRVKGIPCPPSRHQLTKIQKNERRIAIVEAIIDDTYGIR